MIVKANAEMDLKTLETHMAADEEAVEREVTPTEAGVNPVEIDLTGEWEIPEEDKAYQAMLDAMGNGSYSWQEGRIQTEKVADRLWSGIWHQKGNDREGAFEVFLSEDEKTADGVWWSSEERLNRIPYFLRAMVKKGVERHAIEEGIPVVTIELMEELRKRRFGNEKPVFKF